MAMKETRRQETPRRVLLGIVIGIAILLIPSLVGIQWFSRTHPVYQRGLEIVRGSQVAIGMIGEPIETGWWVTGLARRNTSEFRVTLSGSRGEAEAIINGKRVEGKWTLRYVWLKPPAGKIQTLPEAKGLVVE